MNGVRFFDMRVKLKNEQWVMVHGDYELGFKFERDMLNPIYRFLDLYPSECIIMRIKRDSGGLVGFNEPFAKYINKERNRWLLQNNVPTLNMCRGKIFALREEWQPPSGIKVREWELEKSQDEYELKDNWRRRRRFFKKIGKAFSKAAKKVVRGTKKAAKAVARGTKHAAKAVARGTKHAANAVAKVFKDGANSVAKVAKDWVMDLAYKLGSATMKHVATQFIAIVDETHCRLRSLDLLKGKDAASKKLKHILSFHSKYFVTNFNSNYLHVNFWSYVEFTRLKVPQLNQDTAEVMRKMDIIPQLEGSNVGICVFDFPSKFQLEQVFCRNYGTRNGKCFK